MKINGCAACRKCFTTGKACAFDDDFNILAPMLERADIVVFCTPLYWFTFPAPLKSAIDKLYAYTVGKKNLKGKEAILMVCAGLDDEKYFDGILKTYEFILHYLGWQNREIITVKKVIKRGDIKNTNALEKAKNIGANIL
jgi:multimeric flavodoxin WrbA